MEVMDDGQFKADRRDQIDGNVVLSLVCEQSSRASTRSG
jgi:hypothetical protein